MKVPRANPFEIDTSLWKACSNSSTGVCNSIGVAQFTGFFLQNFWWRLAFRGRFSVPIGDGVRWGGGNLEKLSAEAKNAPLQQILVF